MPLPFNKALDLKLIKLVKDNSIIYNSTHPKHLDFDAREVVWQKIGDALSRPAVEFAGIQCQVHYGDFQEDKHKPGFFENLEEYLPEQYSGAWGVEKKILKEFRRHMGISQIDAKHLYTKTARDLPTYGVTFFLVKEKMKGKKKLVPRLLGINAESILRLDETTKEILQVWPLTQVKTYHAGKAETFTLDFGDYSDKEYSVKTNDAHRIRDILQGYIDIIRKRMDASRRLSRTEHHAIGEDHVHADRGHIMTHVEHNSNKIVEETFVGPSQIITYEPGQAIAQGTQIMTVQQVVVTSKGGNQQTVTMGEVPMRKDMSLDFVRKLNRLNSNSVKIVTLLTDPSESNMSEAGKIIDTMEADMPSITEGVQETAAKKTSDEAKKKLLSELQELRDCMLALVHAANVQHNPAEAQEAGKRIADLSTQMFFSLDPAMQKRGKFCRDSRKSFIQDDAMDATLRRASHLAAARAACISIDHAREQLEQEYRGPLLDAADVAELEAAAAGKMGKLNAAVAMYLTAYADPKNIDYGAAVTSINTMNELLPELVKDAKALSSVKDGKNREGLLDAIRALCDAMKNVCLAADPDDHQKMHEDVKEYCKISDKLLFTFKRGGGVEKQNEIIELSKIVGEKASLLLMKANELTGRVPDAEAAILDDAGVRCADAAQDLITCATLTAPSIHEPHCQSALTAAAEALSTSAQHLAVTWKPLVEDPSRRALGEDLRDKTMELAKALDKLKGAFAGLDGIEEPDEVRKTGRLKFVTSVANAKNRMNAAEAELDTPVAGGPQKPTEEELRRRLAQRMAQLNAALAALVAASADRDKPDYATAELAVNTIGELMPDIVKDGKLLSANTDEQTREQMLAELRALCDSTRDIYLSADNGGIDDLNKLASKVAASSGRLCFKFNPHSGRAQEQQILDLSSASNEKASQLLAEVEDVARKLGGQAGTELETARLKAADAVGAFQTAAQLTAPSIRDPRCQAVLVSSANTLSAASQHLAAAWQPVHQAGMEQDGLKLEERRMQLERKLDALRKALQDTETGVEEPDEERKTRRLKFVTSVANAKNRMNAAEAEFDKPVAGGPQKQTEEELRRRLAQRMAQLNAALAALVAASADRDKPDYATAELAVNTIGELMPDIVKDGKLLSANTDEQTREQMLAELRALCDSTRDIYLSADNGGIDDLNKLASKVAASSGRLCFKFNPHSGRAQEQQILDFSLSANEKASQLLAEVEDVARKLGGQAGTELETARRKAADAAGALQTAAQLTAPSIHDPRCKAVLVSSANTLSAASQHLAAAWQPVHESGMEHEGQKLEERRMQLERKLDALRKALQDTETAAAEEPEEVKAARRLRFVATVTHAKQKVQAARAECDNYMPADRQKHTEAELKAKLAQRVAELHAALAPLVAASADRSTPGYATAERAAAAIAEVMPHIVKDGKLLSTYRDDNAAEQMRAQLRALCDHASAIYDSTESGNMDDVNKLASAFAASSGKLLFVFKPAAVRDKEQQVLAISSSANEKASQLLNGVQELAQHVDGRPRIELETAAVKAADAANTLQTTAQLTAHSLPDPRCQATLVSAANALLSTSQHLASRWTPLVKEPRFAHIGKDLEDQRLQLERELDRLKKACVDIDVQPSDQHSLEREQQRLQFLKSVAAAGNQVQAAERELNKPTVPPKQMGVQETGASAPKLRSAIGRLRAAAAALAAAARDLENPDYAAADKAVNAITQLLPQIVKEAKSQSLDQKSRGAALEDLKAMCDATKGLLATTHSGEDLNNSAVQLATASGKLLDAFDPLAGAEQDREHRILDLSSSACEQASRLLSIVHSLAAGCGGEAGGRLDTAGSKLADRANSLLTTAQLTAPCIQEPECRSVLQSSTESVQEASEQLASTWLPLVQDKSSQILKADLEKAHQQLERDLEELKKACQLDNGVPPHEASPLQRQRRLELSRTAAAAGDSLQRAAEHLDKPAEPQGAPPAAARAQLAERLAQLRAAVAALLAATQDPKNADYDAAERAIHEINKLTPLVVKETKTLSAGQEPEARGAALQHARDMCAAAQHICRAAAGNTQLPSEHVASFAESSGKLYHTVSPQLHQAKEREVLGLSSSVCARVGAHAAALRAMAEPRVLTAAARAQTAAETLRAHAQLTAASVHEPRSRAALLAAAAAVTSSVQALSDAWSPIIEDPRHAAKRSQLNAEKMEVEQAVEQLKAAVVNDGPGVNVVKSPLKKAPPPPPVRTTSHEGAHAQHTAHRAKTDFNQEFLDTLRSEETQGGRAAALAAAAQKKSEAQTLMKQQLVDAVDSAVRNIEKAEDNITKVYSGAGVVPEQALALQQQLEAKLAAAAAAAALLLAADQSELDYAAATKATAVLSEVMPNIVQDAKSLRGAMSEGESKQFLEDVLAMADSARVLLGAAKNDHKRINESAMAFGNKSAKLLYVVSTDIDPAQEKEVYSRARVIADSACRLAAMGGPPPRLGAAAAGEAPPRLGAAPRLGQAAAALADAAGSLLYSTKLLAPTVQRPECSQILIHCTEDVTQKLHEYTSTFETIDKIDPKTTAEFKRESETLESLLGSLKEDLSSGKLVKKRVVERVVVENTPLRQLACKILEDAKRRAEHTSTSEDQRRTWAAYANELGQAVRAMDLAYYRSSRAPHDTKKRLALEEAVQALQLHVLTRRPQQANAQNHIVDLTDYVRAVSEDADKLLIECKKGQPELQMVKEHCERIKDYAARTMNPEQYEPTPAEGAPADDRGEVAQFAEDCEKRVRTLNSIISALKDGKTKIDLQEKAASLEESTNLLMFATKSDAATTSSVALDAALEELIDLETNLQNMLAPAGRKPSANKGSASRPCSGRVALALAAGAGRGLAPAAAAYADDERANGAEHPARAERSAEHLRKVLRLLQALTMADSRHVATWQHGSKAEAAAITEQILKELVDYNTECNGNQKSVLSEIDVNALLLPNTTKVQVEKKQVPEKLNQAASKLSSTAGMIIQSVPRPDSLARSLHAAAAAATHLAAVAAAHPQDIAHSQKIDEAAKEMSLQTYNVLKTAEFVSQDPTNLASRRKLMDACRLLNDAINQLVKTSLPGQPLQHECCAAVQRLQLQQSALLAPRAAAAAGYADTQMALANQRDVIHKLISDAALPREQFRRSLSHAAGAVAHATECAAHAAYLLSIADQHRELATQGFADTPRIQSLSEAVQVSCHRIINTDVELAEEEAPILTKHVQDFQQAVAEAQDKIKGQDREQLKESREELEEAIIQLNSVARESVLNRPRLTAASVRVVDASRAVVRVVGRAAAAPEAEASAEASARSEDVVKHCRNLNTKMLSLIREVRAAEEQDTMTWVTFGTSRQAVLDMFEALLNSVKVNGKRAGVLESQSDSEEEMNQAKKSFVQIQLHLANKWLARPSAAAAAAAAGQQASATIISLAEKICEDSKGQEKEEMQLLVTESQELLAECQKKRDQAKASLLMERLKTLKKAIERGVVSRVVENFLEGEEPLADLDILADAERDEGKRKYLLERKIAELLAHLGRVTRTAKVVAGAGGGALGGQLLHTSMQTELLAPMLVQAAQKRVISPDDQAAIAHYQKLLAEYAEQLAHMRELCDQAVDPMDFVQHAGETMQRMREDKTYDNNPQMSAYASTAITKLAHRVINVSMSSSDVRKDPELQKALREAKERLKAAVPKPNDRPSRIPDWKVTTGEILRTTGEVESVLGGEMIFKKQQTSDQPIFAAALDLHTAIRSWSAKDNEIVAVAKRMAVLMAKLSDYMNTDRKRDVIFAAKSIVTESQEVADLARKLANECTDVRIKTNLLKVCERIPTISGQLKMLATVKGSLGHQGLKEDQEDMNMLVGNAQNLMLSVQEAVNAAASASVKINSQRMRWVRKAYY